MRTIKFTEDRHFQRTGENFKAGEIHVLRDDQAARWVRRNAAVYVNLGTVLLDAGDLYPPEVETVVYADGTVATGVAPLPNLSPFEQEAVSVDPVVSPADVEKSDGSDSGVRPQYEQGRGRGRPPGKHSGNRNK